MTMTSVRLAGSLQTLIDSRLDTIERMLMGRVPRQDRLAIVKDVETQIFDLLQERGTDEPTREDVLAALARLDPPEAYLPEDGGMDEERPVVSRRSATVRTIAAPPNRPENSKIGTISGIVGISAVIVSVLSPLSYALGMLFESEILLFVLAFGSFGLIFCGSLVGLTLAIAARFRGAWAIVGGVLSPISLLYSIFATFVLGRMILG